MFFVDQILARLIGYPFVLGVSGIVLCRKLQKRRFFWLRLLALPCFIAFFAMGMHYGFLDYYMFPHAVAYVCYSLILWLCFEMNPFQALFFESVAYLFEHIFANIKQLLSAGLAACGLPDPEGVVFILISLAIEAVLLTAVAFILSPRLPGVMKLFTEYKAVFIVMILLNLCFTIVISDLLRMSGETIIILQLFRIAICIALVVLPFLVFRILNDKMERHTLQNMLILSEKQHEMSSENIDAINMRCHDLKQQIAALRTPSGEKARDALIEQLEKEVMMYDSVAKTGIGPLDVLLTEKSMICYKFGIEFIYDVDSGRLAFMDIIDLYTLLGNALDNAIEAVRGLDEGKRLISLKVAGRGSMTVISVENYCEKKIEFDGELPKTTKSDKLHHGYGLKSIRAIAGRYGGEMLLGAKDNIFTLDVLFTSCGKLRKQDDE